MKKFLTLLSAALVAVASLATVASADPMATDIYEPKAALDIVALDEGAAVVAISFEVNEDLGLVNEGSKYVPKYTGAALTAWQIDIDFNKDILDIDNALLYAPVAGSYNGDFTLALGSADKLVDMGVAVIPVQPAYADKTAEELNELDFATITYAETEITVWSKASAAKNFSTQTSYRSDGQGDFLVGSRVGVEADEPVTPPATPDFVMTEKTDADAAWEAETGKNAVYWGVKFAEGKFNNYSKVVFTAGEEKKEREISADDSFDVNGEVEFAIVVIADEAITNVVTADIQ